MHERDAPMKTIFSRLLAGLALALALATAAVAQDRTTLLVNLTTDDAWTSQMALGLARNVQSNGGDVVVFLNVRAVTLANADVPQHTQAASGKTAHEMIAAIIEAGGRVFLCRGCTKQAGLEIDDRIEGVEPSGPALMKVMTAPGTRIISY